MMSNNGFSHSTNSNLLDRLIREEGDIRLCVPFSRVRKNDLEEFTRLVREGYLVAIQPFGFYYEVTEKGAYGKLGEKNFKLAKEHYPNMRAATRVEIVDRKHVELGGVWQLDPRTGERWHTVLVQWQEVLATYPSRFGGYVHDVARFWMGYDDRVDVLYMTDKVVRRA